MKLSLDFGGRHSPVSVVESNDHGYEKILATFRSIDDHPAGAEAAEMEAAAYCRRLRTLYPDRFDPIPDDIPAAEYEVRSLLGDAKVAIEAVRLRLARRIDWTDTKPTPASRAYKNMVRALNEIRRANYSLEEE